MQIVEQDGDTYLYPFVEEDETITSDDEYIRMWLPINSNLPIIEFSISRYFHPDDFYEFVDSMKELRDEMFYKMRKTNRHLNVGRCPEGREWYQSERDILIYLKLHEGSSTDWRQFMVYMRSINYSDEEIMESFNNIKKFNRVGFGESLKIIYIPPE